VLVFCKGDPKRATEAIGQVEFGEIDEADGSADEGPQENRRHFAATPRRLSNVTLCLGLRGSNAVEYRFHIDDSFTPASIPMERLAEDIKALAQLMGETTSVHFGGVTQGSVVLQAEIDQPAQVKVRERVNGVSGNQANKDAAKAYGVLDEMLRKDNATGKLVDGGGAVIIPFPGKNRPEPVIYGPFRQDGTLEGQVIRVGGKDDTIPVHLRDGAIVHTGLSATEDVARRIAKHLLGPTIRVHGTGTWFRGGDGTWQLKSFKISDFDLLDETPLGDVVARLRAVRGSGWSEVPDPVRELLEDRHGGTDRH